MIQDPVAVSIEALTETLRRFHVIRELDLNPSLVLDYATGSVINERMIARVPIKVFRSDERA